MDGQWGKIDVKDHEVPDSITADESAVMGVSDPVKRYSDTMNTLKEWCSVMKDDIVGVEALQQLQDPDVYDKLVRSFKHFSKDAMEISQSILDQDLLRWKETNGNFMYEGRDMGAPFQFLYYNERRMEIPPIINPNGSMFSYHAHIIPALMLNQLIRKTSGFKNNSTTTYVLCQGNKFVRHQKWWGEAETYKNDNEKADAIVDFLMASPDFNRIFRIMVNNSFGSGKSLKRLMVWLKAPYHVFSLVWEVYLHGDLKSLCYTIDNLGNTDLNCAISNVFLVKIKEKISAQQGAYDLNPQNISALDSHIPRISQSHLHMSRDLSLMCVSFMARSTLYMSMINWGKLQTTITKFHEPVGPDLERVAYDKFNVHLLAFLSLMQRERKAVWISPINEYFVDIQKICLVAIDPTDPTKQVDYTYKGADIGFVRCSRDCEFNSCIINSQYPPLALVRECRSTLQGLRLC